MNSAAGGALRSHVDFDTIDVEEGDLEAARAPT